MEKLVTNEPKIFFSYARTDGTEHALQLANRLREAGANVWIDQQNIELGKLWDLEVEKALNDANCVLFIATERSVASNNVLNEVYYALDENKTVIPVLFHNCRIPFQLRRLQHIDFTTDYEGAFGRLLKALGLGAGVRAAASQTATAATARPEPEPVAEALAAKQPEQIRPMVQQPEPAPRKEPQPAPGFATESKEAQSNGQRKKLLWGGGLVAAALLVFFLVRGLTNGGTDPQAGPLIQAKQQDLTTVPDSISKKEFSSGHPDSGRKAPIDNGKKMPPKEITAGRKTNGPVVQEPANDHEEKFGLLAKEGYAKMKAGDYKAAIQSFEAAAELKADPEIYYQMAIAYGNLGQTSTAIDYYGKAISLNPKNWAYYNARGGALRRNNDFKAAISDLDQAISLAEKEAAPYNIRGLCKKALGDADGACKDFFEAGRLGGPAAQRNYDQFCGGKKTGINLIDKASLQKAKRLPTQLEKAQTNTSVKY